MADNKKRATLNIPAAKEKDNFSHSTNRNNIYNQDNDDDDVVEIVDNEHAEDAAVKLQELKKKLPFINSVMKMFRPHLSDDQYKKLEMLKQLLGRSCLSLQTINKINGVLGKLEIQFQARVIINITEDSPEETPAVSTNDTFSESLTSNKVNRSNWSPSSVCGAARSQNANVPEPIRKDDSVNTLSQMSTTKTDWVNNSIQSKNRNKESDCNVKDASISAHTEKKTLQNENSADFLTKTKTSVAAYFVEPKRASITELDKILTQTGETATQSASSASLEEARKKLAALRSNAEPFTPQPQPLASNVNDPRRRLPQFCNGLTLDKEIFNKNNYNINLLNKPAVPSAMPVPEVKKSLPAPLVTPSATLMKNAGVPSTGGRLNAIEPSNSRTFSGDATSPFSLNIAATVPVSPANVADRWSAIEPSNLRISNIDFPAKATSQLDTISAMGRGPSQGVNMPTKNLPLDHPIPQKSNNSANNNVASVTNSAHFFNGPSNNGSSNSLNEESRCFTNAAATSESRDPRRNQQTQKQGNPRINDPRWNRSNVPSFNEPNLRNGFGETNMPQNVTNFNEPTHENAPPWLKNNYSGAYNGPYRGGYRGRGHGPNYGSRYQTSPHQSSMPQQEPRTYKEHREAKARGAAAAKVAKQNSIENIPASEIQLDTSYRTVNLKDWPKKIDFKIPKKSSTKIVSGDQVCDQKEKKSQDGKKCTDKEKSKDNNKEKQKIKSKEKEKVEEKVNETEKNKEKLRAKEKIEETAEVTKKHHQPIQNKDYNGQPKKLNKPSVVKENEKNQKETKRDKYQSEKTAVEGNSAKPGRINVEKEVKSAAGTVKGSSLKSSNDVAKKENDSTKKMRKSSQVKEIDNKNQFDIPSNKEIKNSAPKVDKPESETTIVKAKDGKPGNDRDSQIERIGNMEDDEKETLNDECKGNDKNNLVPAEMDVETPNDASTCQTEQVSNLALPKLQRLLKRRSSMAPFASKALIDQSDVIPNYSLLYEDLQEQNRKNEDDDKVTKAARLSKSLAHMFEKTTDNCTVSTQNIIVGKLRTRANELILNEVELTRTAFKHAKPKSKSNGQKDTNLSGKRKRGRPSRSTEDVTDTLPADELPAAKRVSSEATKSSDTLPADELSSAKRVCSEKTKSIDTSAADELPTPKRVCPETTKLTDTPPADELPEANRVCSETSKTTEKKPRRTKRNELEKLNEDIAAMYYGDDVMRATGRRACAQTQQATIPKDESDSVLPVSSQISNSSRNTARRGRKFSGPSRSGIDRVTIKGKIEPKLKLKRCLVRLQKFDKHMMAFSQPVVKNTNKEWHVLSQAVGTCVVCENPIKSTLSHYVQHHGEVYTARFPPGVLKELQASNLNRPLYGMLEHSKRYHHTCPFCQKTLNITSNSWIEHFSRHTGELNYQCSKCLCPQYRPGHIEKHVLSCQPGAKVIVNNFYNVRLPCRAYVCHICEFVQLNLDNVIRHYSKHHGLTREAVAGSFINIILYHHENVPMLASKREADVLEEQHKSQSKNKYKFVLDQDEPSRDSGTDEGVDKIEPLEETLEPPLVLDPTDSEQVQPIIVINAASPAEDNEASECEEKLEIDQEENCSDAKDSIVVETCKLRGNLSGISSDVTQDDEWIDVQSDESEIDDVPRKSLFQKFNKLVTKIVSKSLPKRRKSKDTRSTCSETSEGPTENKNRLSIKKLPPKLKVSTALVNAPDPANTAATVENVAYRLRNAATNDNAYYCMKPCCNFSFSNELEGLEIHFAQDHPAARWSGHCNTCNKLVEANPSAISAELLHMVEIHVKTAISSHKEQEQPKPIADIAPETNPVPISAPDQALPKLTVRRFTGDRLAGNFENTNNNQSIPNTTEYVGNSNSNATLRELLVAEPRVPTQQADINAAGLSEFLSAKSAPNNSVISSDSVVNHPTELGLVIGQVFSLTDTFNQSDDNEPVLTSEAVSLPPAQSGDFLLTQSITQHYDSIPQIHIAISHQANGLVTTNKETNNETLPEAPLPDTTIGRSSADRFRCMAANCTFESPTVFRIRQHMDFHRLGFGNSDYLQCAYCSHKASDVESYIQHGIAIHNLPPDTEQQKTVDALNEQIRNELNKRKQPTDAHTIKLAKKVTSTGKASASRDSTASKLPLNKVIRELILPTGVSADRVYACPQKDCNASLHENDFVAHIMFHMNSRASNMNIRCKHCKTPVFFERPGQLRLHLERCHQRHSYFCGYCLATTADQLQMQHHIRSVHKADYTRGKRQMFYKELPGNDDFWMCLCELPTKIQMNDFINQLSNELDQRKGGTKRIYHPSEMQSLPRQPYFNTNLECGECMYQSNIRVNFKGHLQAHINASISAAYDDASTELHGDKSDEDTTALNCASSDQALPSTAVNEITTAATTGVPPSLPSAVASDEVTPGVHIIGTPKYGYVPEDVRYTCGVLPCSLQFPTEREFRNHLNSQHSYKEVFYCQHCHKSVRGNLTLENVMSHLQLHKQHIYQCGACSNYQCKRGIVERHITGNHSGKDVDLIIHKRTELNKKLGLARWIKPPRNVVAQQNDYVCFVCQKVFPTYTEAKEHAFTLHGKNWQYTCPYCDCGSNEPVDVIQHILREHPNLRVQPSQVFQRIKLKDKLTLGYYCNTCFAVASVYSRIKHHCEEQHQSGTQFKCAHCDCSYTSERNTTVHMMHEHPGLVGLAVQQFVRITNEVPDADSWNEGQPIQLNSDRVILGSLSAAHAPMAPNAPNTAGAPSTTTVTSTALTASDQEIEIISSDEQENEDQQKTIEFGCAHCHETSDDAEELRKQHYPMHHPDLPFYFNVQPQLRCVKCNVYTGNTRALLDHLLNVHHIRNLIACDTLRPNECAYCEHKFLNWTELAHHINAVGHTTNDMKNLVDAELNDLLKLNAGVSNDYFQCNVCSAILPTQVAMARHGSSEHKNAEDLFCFRKLTVDLIFHCPFCMYAATSEMDTLRHMMVHYKKFSTCQFCQNAQEGGFDEYIQHCYNYHRMDVCRFREVHSYVELEKFMVQLLYHFQNGLIVSKASLRQTRFHNETPMRELYEYLMGKSQQPPIPRIVIRRTSIIATDSSTEQKTVKAKAFTPSAVRITQRRKTFNPSILNPEASAISTNMSFKPLASTSNALSKNASPKSLVENLMARSASGKGTLTVTKLSANHTVSGPNISTEKSTVVAPKTFDAPNLRAPTSAAAATATTNTPLRIMKRRYTQQGEYLIYPKQKRQ